MKTDPLAIALNAETIQGVIIDESSVVEGSVENKGGDSTMLRCSNCKQNTLRPGIDVTSVCMHCAPPWPHLPNNDVRIRERESWYAQHPDDRYTDALSDLAKVLSRIDTMDKR